MKKSISLLLTLVMVVCTLSSTLLVTVATAVTGTTGLTYELNADGESYSVTGLSEAVEGQVIIPAEYNGLPVTKVAKNAFYNDETVTDFVVGDNVTTIEAYAFFRTNASTIELPEGLKVIEACGVYGFESVDIPDSVEYIGQSGVLANNYVEDNGYYYIDNWLIEAAVDGGPDRVEVLDGTVGIADSIIEYIDENTGEKFISIPASVKYIGTYSLYGYAGAYIADDNPYFEKKNGVIYTEDMKRAVFGSPAFCGGELTIPDGVEKIDLFAFADCTNLLWVTIPESVTDFTNGLSHFTDLLSPDEAEVLNKPGLCFAFMNLLDTQAEIIDFSYACSSPAANISYVKTFSDPSDFTYHYKSPYHFSVTIPGRQATCTADGLTDGTKCERCDKILFAQQVIPAAHTYCEMTVCIAPTTTTAGEGRVTCEKCGEYSTVTLAKVPVCPKTQAVNDVNGIKVTWNEVENAEYYAVFRRNAGSSQWIQLDTVYGTEYVDRDVVNDKYYIYSVKAYNKDAYASAYNSSLCKTVRCVSSPVLTSVQNVTGGIQIKWGAVAGADTYRVYRRGAGSTYWTYLGDVKNTSYVDSKASSGKYWRYTVRVVNSGYYSGFDTSGLYTMRLANPYSIKTANSLSGVTVTWGKINGATGYRIYRKAAGQSSWSYIGASTSNTFTDKNVKSGTYYKYTVRATRGNIYSWFNDGSLIKYMQAPVISGHSTTTKNLTIRWNAVSGATGYRVYRRGAGEGWKYITTVKGTSYTDSKVTKNSYYRYTIRSVSGNYISGYDNNGYLLKFTASSAGSSSSITANSIMSNPLGAYQKAASQINKYGSAGYNKVAWQTINSTGIYPDNSNISPILKNIMESYLTSEADAEVHVMTKGSAEAKKGMPVSTCSTAYVKSASAVKQGENYLITIVMKDQVNPKIADTDGLNVMSKDLLYEEDVRYTIENDGTVNQLVRRYDSGKIKYVNYTIKALMTPSGRFISITHSTDVMCEFHGSVMTMGDCIYSFDMSFGTRYTNFTY